ncbi:GNAT family N-acetyltransferase [Bosea sp. FBZP-16]|uniref:GNAT family N-acetyltransferase n=1 Tax=Bosea sp. FBZP-16 TaxID=2065382 RepID=UPI000C3147E5|nr:GNAT family N-acetyltransferase [Bosea sp. FBZP-16]
MDKTVIDTALVSACETRIVNAWPAPTTLVVDQWVVRFANGYSGRANSASSLREDGDMDETTLAFVEGLYRQAGLPPRIRFTPLVAESARRRFAERGYRIETASFGMVAELDPNLHPPAPGMLTTAQAEDAWIDGVCAHQTGAKRNREHLAAIVSGVRVPAAFATLLHEGRPAAYAMSVAERGMAEIGAVIVDEALRGKGLGKQMMLGLMGWAAEQGCSQAYLQVDQSNGLAFEMYKRLGFRTVYAYETRMLDT